jgi:hypothetical protein
MLNFNKVCILTAIICGSKYILYNFYDFVLNVECNNALKLNFPLTLNKICSIIHDQRYKSILYDQ